MQVAKLYSLNLQAFNRFVSLVFASKVVGNLHHEFVGSLPRVPRVNFRHGHSTVVIASLHWIGLHWIVFIYK